MKHIEALNLCRAKPAVVFTDALAEARREGFDFLWFNGKIYCSRMNSRSYRYGDEVESPWSDR